MVYNKAIQCAKGLILHSFKIPQRSLLLQKSGREAEMFGVKILHFVKGKPQRINSEAHFYKGMEISVVAKPNIVNMFCRQVDCPLPK